jgi:hypothetical protein
VWLANCPVNQQDSRRNGNHQPWLVVETTSARSCMTGGAGAAWRSADRRLSLRGLVVSVRAVVKWVTHEPVSLPSARPSTTITPSPPNSVQPVTPPVAAPAAFFRVDDRGFVNSDARCDDTQTAVAIGRTPARAACHRRRHGDQAGTDDRLPRPRSLDGVLGARAASSRSVTSRSVSRNGS